MLAMATEQVHRLRRITDANYVFLTHLLWHPMVPERLDATGSCNAQDLSTPHEPNKPRATCRSIPAACHECTSIAQQPVPVMMAATRKS